jgi:aryl-alcohol dehydrogenase-like predicted oxidoreductase
MILGTVNFDNNYNNTYLSKEEAFNILEYYQKNGGGIIDTAENYNSNYIINEYVKVNGQENLKIQTKIWNINDMSLAFEKLKACKIYSVLSRGQDTIDLLYLKDTKKEWNYDVSGQSIYFPHELNQKCNIIQAPLDLNIWNNYLPTMSLYATVQFRSCYNLYSKYKTITKLDLTNYEKLKRSGKIQFVIGVDNIKQLKENMRKESVNDNYMFS